MKKILTLLIFLQTAAFSSLVWDLNSGINEFGKNPSGAIDYFKYYINANPNDPQGYWWLGMSYLKSGDKLSAQKTMLRAYKKSYDYLNIERIELPEDEYDNLEDYFDMASMCFEQGNLKEADTYIDMMLKIDPDSSSAYFMKAKIALSMGKAQKAHEYMEHAVILNSSLLNTNLAKNLNITELPKLSLEQYSIFAFKSYFQGNIKDASMYAQKYIEKDKYNPDMYNLLIDCYIKAKKIDTAKETLNEALTYNKNNISLLIKKAQLNKQNQIDILLKAYEINPNNKELLLEIANYYLSVGDFKNSKKYFEYLINVDNSIYEAHFGHIYSLIHLRQTDKAINRIKVASSLNRDTSEIEFLLSKICSMQADYNEALEYMDMAIKKEPNPKYYYEAAKLSYILGDYNKSLSYIKKGSLKTSYEILDYLKLNDIQNAKLSLKNVGELDKNTIMYKYYLYKICKLENNEQGARQYLDEIEKYKPANISQYIDLAIVYALLGNNTASSNILEQADKKYKDSIELYIAKLEIYYMTANMQKLKSTISQSGNIQNN